MARRGGSDPLPSFGGVQTSPSPPPAQNQRSLNSLEGVPDPSPVKGGGSLSCSAFLVLNPGRGGEGQDAGRRRRGGSQAPPGRGVGPNAAIPTHTPQGRESCDLPGSEGRRQKRGRERCWGGLWGGLSKGTNQLAWVPKSLRPPQKNAGSISSMRSTQS